MKNSFVQLLLLETPSLPLVISTGAPKERSGGTCGSVALPWKCFSTASRYHKDGLPHRGANKFGPLSIYARELTKSRNALVFAGK